MRDGNAAEKCVTKEQETKIREKTLSRESGRWGGGEGGGTKRRVRGGHQEEGTGGGGGRWSLCVVPVLVVTGAEENEEIFIRGSAGRREGTNHP